MINRFPKMMLLWYEILSLEYPTVPAQVRLAAAYTVALGYAILKNARMNTQTEPKEKMQFDATPQDAKVWNELEIPGKHPPFLKKVKYEIHKHGVLVVFNGEVQDFYAKALKQLKKFTPFELERYKEFAAETAKQLKRQCYTDWFETWKQIRDLDWSSTQLQLSIRV